MTNYSSTSNSQRCGLKLIDRFQISRLIFSKVSTKNWWEGVTQKKFNMFFFKSHRCAGIHGEARARARSSSILYMRVFTVQVHYGVAETKSETATRSYHIVLFIIIFTHTFYVYLRMISHSPVARGMWFCRRRIVYLTGWL